MTKPSDAQAMEEAATIHEHCQACADDSANYWNAKDSFKAGWQAARAKQSVEVEMLVEALEFYADKTNWRETDPNNRPAGMTYSQKITSRDSSSPDGSYDFCGGKHARTALARYKESGK